MPTHLAFVIYASLIFLVVSAVIWLCDERATHRGLAVVLVVAACGFLGAALREYQACPRQSDPRPRR